MDNKEKEKEEILKQTIVEEENPSDLLAEKIQKQKKKQNKSKNIKIALGCFVLLIFLTIQWLFKPFKTSAEYGICRSFLELHVLYPHTITVSEIKQQRNGGLKLWYTHIDGFGEYRIENFQCKLAKNPETGLTEIYSIKIHKVDLDPETIKHLNSAMPYFAENPLALDWPPALPDSLRDLHFEFDKFRKIIINNKKY